MSSSRGPTVRQRRLGSELRALREGMRFKGDEVAHRLSWSTAKVSRLENARTGARVDDVVELLKLYGVTGDRRDDLVKLAESATERGWWEDYPSVNPAYAELIAIESDASTALCWENLVVHGLLQTREYALSLSRGWNVLKPTHEREIQRWVDVRMRRQKVLDSETPLHMDVIFDEAVLRRKVGEDKVMTDQLAHLVEMANRPNIEIRVFPLDEVQPISSPPFTLMRFERKYGTSFPDIVHTESISFVYVHEEKETFQYDLSFTALRKKALPPAPSLAFLEDMHAQWQERSQKAT
ncbi:helix-turn-helix domain-containing protein [Actinomadura parmotrematis]|uniref:Helix-turn-helix domain-containing protein n=1 Tax=Actinomadura parmotrematis TaxID=2864039 RepID=A0ABS7G4Y1_9ACTN|nr:helix-turn-helix transcriptional regulator [Actinomadura parmotrematis]MBW8487435.1 helix-turn-helix domain-containing protein [Actinomadura parmotrematis]